jgi:hypothetical protein
MALTLAGKLWYKIRYFAQKYDPYWKALRIRNAKPRPINWKHLADWRPHIPYHSVSKNLKTVIEHMPFLAILTSYLFSVAYIWIKILPLERQADSTGWFVQEAIINGLMVWTFCRGASGYFFEYDSAILHKFRHYVDVGYYWSLRDVVVKIAIYIFFYAYAIFLALIWPKFAFTVWCFNLIFISGILVLIYKVGRFLFR